jgi:alkyl hydroperoxide reductase subunit AhpC
VPDSLPFERFTTSEPADGSLNSTVLQINTDEPTRRVRVRLAANGCVPNRAGPVFRSHAPHCLPAQHNDGCMPYRTVPVFHTRATHSPARTQRPTSATTSSTSLPIRHMAPSTGTRTLRGDLSSALRSLTNLNLPTSRLLSSSKLHLRAHLYLCRAWAILFSHPNDFTPVCTTELGSVESLKDEFQRRGVKVAALSCNDVESHGVCQPAAGRWRWRWRPTTRLAIDTLARGCTEAWIKDIVAVNQCKGPGLHYPIIADPERTVAHALGMLDGKARDAGDMPLTCRAVYIIGPDKKLKLSLLYPASTGRNFGEDRSAYSTRSLQPTSHLHRHPHLHPHLHPRRRLLLYPRSRPHPHTGPPRARLVTAYGAAQPCHPCQLEARRQVHGVIICMAPRHIAIIEYIPTLLLS